jgi:outer membrane receptor protein involved in Fe transport
MIRYFKTTWFTHVAGIVLPILLLATFPGSTANAQSPGKIQGQVLATDGSPLPYASIRLQKQDGELLKGTLSDTLGRFALVAVPMGNYVIKVNTMGFVMHQSKVFTLLGKNQSLELEAITLIEEAMTLGAVTIKGQKRLIEQTIDKTVMNVENSILAEGNTALELLQKAPGVSIGEDGQVSLKGRPNVLVMLNGKSTYLSPKELSTLLKGTNSASIAKIEIMSNPSAKYDASGNGGIINIQLKKNMVTGFNGTATLNGGRSRNARYGSGINLNYRSEKINMYGSYDYAYRGETEYLDFVRRFYDSGVATGQADRTSNQRTETNEPLNTNNFRLGLDYDFNANNSFGFLINGNVGRYTHDSQTGNVLTSTAGSLLSNLATTNYDKQHWKNLTYNLNYRHKFEKEGRELSADADFASNHFTSNLNLNTVTLATSEGQANTAITRRGYVPAVTDVYLAKIDYVDPLSKTVKFETGLKSSYTSSDNNLRYDLLTDGDWLYDATGSNHFTYKEQIHAGYINLNKEFKGFSIQAGLRGEYTKTEGHQITTDSLITRNYFQLFPSVFLNKPIGAQHQLQLAYSRRIERPDYGDLNPFRVFRDPLLFYQGNPFLKPELVNTFQLSHSFKSRYTTAVSYNRTRDVMTWVNGQIDSINTTFETPQNLNRLVNYGISFTASTTFFDWWTGTHFVNLYRNEYSGTTAAAAFDNKTTSWSFNSQNTFKAGKGYTIELSGLYYSGSVYGIARYKGNYMVSTGAQKSVLKDKGSLKLMVNDIFQSNRYREATLFQNIDMNTDKRPDSRRVMLSFSYRFGNQNIQKKERKTGSEDISTRVKGGG